MLCKKLIGLKSYFVHVLLREVNKIKAILDNNTTTRDHGRDFISRLPKRLSQINRGSIFE